MHIPLGGGTLCKSKKECITYLNETDFPSISNYTGGIAELDTVLTNPIKEQSGKFCIWSVRTIDLNDFLKNPTSPAGEPDSSNMERTNAPTHFIKLWITKENGQYLDKPKLIWTKEKGQINQKQKPEPTLEETIKNYLKKQKQQRRRKA